MNTAWDSLRPIFGRFVLESKHGLPIARDGTIRVNYFLDLLSACHVAPHRTAIVGFFANWLSHYVSHNVVNAVVGPKRGNTLFAKSVADTLGKKSAFVRDNILFGRWVEGDVRPEDKVLLIDDVASEGEMLLDAVESLRETGVLVDQAYVLVDRPEGDAKRQFQRAGIQYSFAMSLSDADLARLLSEARTSP